MSFEEIIKTTKEEMTKAEKAFEKDLLSVRTGRATTSLLDGIKVDVYGSLMPLAALGSVGVVDARTLSVLIWDAANVALVDSAIRQSDLGLNPKVEGNKLFIAIPDVTEERRKEYIKLVRRKAEDIRIRLRNLRREANDRCKDIEKDKAISSDELKSHLEIIQKLTDDFIKIIDEMLQKKEKDLLSV